MLHKFLLAILTSFLSTGCIQISNTTRSPIVTWNPSEGEIFNTAGGIGTLDISENCARFKYANGALSLLAWPEPTAWNESEQAIEFVSPHDGTQLTLRHGDRIHVTGGSASGEPQYVNPPDPSCEADDIFVLNDVRLVED